MRTSTQGVKAIAKREGTILHVYKDSQGYPTAGVGHLLVGEEKKAFPLGAKITQKQCDDWLTEDLKKCEDAVNSLGVTLKQHEFDALVSLAFNIGVGSERPRKGFKGSTVARKLKAGDKLAAAEAILMWDKPKEIIGRRRTEYNQFLTPYKDSAAPAITPATNLSASKDAVPPTDTPPINSDGSTQIAENIVNTGDKKVPDGFVPETKVVAAPAKENTTSDATKMTIAGIVLPSFIVAAIKSVQELVQNGFLNAKEVGDAVIGFIFSNQKYVFILIGMLILLLIAKKAFKQITLWLEMWIKSDPNRHDVEVQKQ